MADAGIVRNRLKVRAAITNARGHGRAARARRPRALVLGFRPEHAARRPTTEQMVATSPESVALSKALKKAGLRLRRPDHDVRR